MARPLNVLVWCNHMEWVGSLFLGGVMSKEAMLTAEVAVLTEMVRVLSDKLAIEQNKQERGDSYALHTLHCVCGKTWQIDVYPPKLKENT